MCRCPTPFFGHLRASLAYALTIMASLLSAQATLAETYHLPLFVSETTSGQQGVLRVLNLSDNSGSVEVHAIDDLGIRSGPVTLTLDALETLEIDATDLASGGLGTLAGDVRLEFDTDLRIEFLAYLRSADGALVAIHDEVQVEVDGGFEYLVPIFNSATNMAHESRLRLVNPGTQTAMVGIEARDDTGATATGGGVQLTLPSGGAMSLTAQQLEAGDPAIAGQIGAGSGRWGVEGLIGPVHPGGQFGAILHRRTEQPVHHRNRRRRNPRRLTGVFRNGHSRRPKVHGGRTHHVAYSASSLGRRRRSLLQACPGGSRA